MKFGNFKLGKKDNTAVEEEIIDEEIEEVPIDIIQDVEPVQPHPPLQELSLDAEAAVEDDVEITVLDAAAATEEEGEPIKLVEVQPNPEAVVEPPPPPTPVEPPKEPDKKNDPMDLGASISSIFTDEDDEENPLANLIKALPEVAAAELIDDLKEINDIIKDWQKK